MNKALNERDECTRYDWHSFYAVGPGFSTQVTFRSVSHVATGSFY